MIPLLYLLYYLLVKAIGKAVPVFGTRIARRVHRRATDGVARDVEREGIEVVPTNDPPRRSPVRPRVSEAGTLARGDRGV